MPEISTKNNSLLLTPGPVPLHPEVQKILSEPMIHHRTPAFDKVFADVLKGLKFVFQTNESVFIHTSTGTGGMESLLVNCLSPNDEVIAIVSGKFGERWAKMAEVFGYKVHTINVPWGKSITPSQVQSKLTEFPKTRAVLCQACETSTATSHPIKELGDLIGNYPNTLLLVDGITAAGAYPLPMDEWKIDGLVAGSQKAFMLPTGLSFVSFSKKAWSFIEKSTSPRFYFDIRLEKKSNSSGEAHFSSNVPTIRALDIVLKMIEQEGLEKHFARIHRRAEMTRVFGQKLGLELFSESPSDSVTALKLPPQIDGQKVRQELEDKHGITIMGGQDQAKGKIIRIGHMGYISDSDMLLLFEKLAFVLQKFDPQFLPQEQATHVVNELKTWQEKHRE